MERWGPQWLECTLKLIPNFLVFTAPSSLWTNIRKIAAIGSEETCMQSGRDVNKKDLYLLFARCLITLCQEQAANTLEAQPQCVEYCGKGLGSLISCDCKKKCYCYPAFFQLFYLIFGVISLMSVWLNDGWCPLGWEKKHITKHFSS